MNRRSIRNLAATITNRRKRPLVYGIGFIFAAAITALACAWSSVNDHSVRFNDLRSGRAFYRLPPLPLMYDSEKKKEISTFEVENYLYPDDAYYESYGESATPPEPKETGVWRAAVSAAESGDLIELPKHLRSYLQLTELPSYIEEEEEQIRRNSAFDMLDALTALNQGSRPESVRKYINARLAFNNNPSEIANNSLDSADHALRDNWLYLRGASLYATDQKDLALAAFREHAHQYPKSEKSEAVSYMIAKITMESSFSFGNLRCGIMGKKQWSDEELGPDEIEAVEKCKDESWHNAVDAFQSLTRKYGKGRYKNDARGWLAYLYRRGSERPKALAEYYRLLGDPTDRTARLRAKKSLETIGHEYDDKTLDEVERLISDDANAALAYAYHRIYNVAIDNTYQKVNEWCCYRAYGEEPWRQQQERREEDVRVAKLHNAGNHELERVANFAAAMLKRHPQVQVSGGFTLRLAEAQLELQNYTAAEAHSNRALGLGITLDERMEALWVKGSAEHKLRKFANARSTFNKLIAEFPDSKLTEGARRLLAMNAEDMGDLETALDIYLDLGYDTDVAYFVDVLLPTDRLARYIAARKDSTQYNKLLYSLVIRLMRDGRWTQARETLRGVQTEKGTDGYLASDENSTWYFPKETIFDDKVTYIKTSWVMQDLKTIDILEERERTVEQAQGDEQVAEALYQLASAYFESDDLVFYNPAVWGGGRSTSLAGLEFGDNQRLPDESRIILEHLQKHDKWARSIPIFEEVVARFPNTKAARDALYSIAVAHEQLSTRIAPWTKIYERGMFAGSRMVTYADVQNTYPSYQLPRGTIGWEPSTRTVNGGPGWAPKPKPAPPLTRTQKFEKRLKYAGDKFQLLIKPYIDTVTGWAGSLFNGYISLIETFLSWLLTIVAFLLGGYFALLGFHFRATLLAAARRLGGSAIAMEQLSVEKLPSSQSRIEEVINEPDGPGGSDTSGS